MKAKSLQHQNISTENTACIQTQDTRSSLKDQSESSSVRLVKTTLVQNCSRPSFNNEQIPLKSDYYCQVISEHAYAVIESPKEMKRKLDSIIDQLESKKRICKSKQQSLRRMKNKVADLFALVSEFKKR